MASVDKTMPLPNKRRAPTVAALKRGLKAVSESSGMAACIVHKPDGNTLIMPCPYPAEPPAVSLAREFDL